MTTENEVLRLYLSGVGSTTIAQQTTYTKKQVLKILNANGVIRLRHHTDEFYSNFWQEDNLWCGYYTCNQCSNQIKFCVNNKSLLNRNLKNKDICRNCYKLNSLGDGNIFFNKTHLTQTKANISKSKIGICTSNHMSKPEYKKLFSTMALERWENGSMEETRVKLSKLMKCRIASGEIRGYNRSKVEDELITIITDMDLEVIPNFRIESNIFDIYIPKYNLLLEYNGDYWHCNPKKYDAKYYNKKKNKTAKEIWEYDAKKIYLSEKYGYSCEVIWEADYKKDKSILQQIITKYEKPI